MFLEPKKLKYKKIRKGNINNTPILKKKLIYGTYGLIALESGFLRANQLEAVRQTINRHIKRKGKIWILTFPDLGVTKRPTQIRIGKGTGKIKYWVSRITTGQIVFEIEGVSLKVALLALFSGAQKLPFKVKFLKP
jgi:large subunit ribosomal protein L16